jgi:hypothetical protein
VHDLDVFPKIIIFRGDINIGNITPFSARKDDFFAETGIFFKNYFFLIFWRPNRTKQSCCSATKYYYVVHKASVIIYVLQRDYTEFFLFYEFTCKTLAKKTFFYINTPAHMERSHSGLVRTLGKGVWGNPPGVRISLSPPFIIFHGEGFIYSNHFIAVIPTIQIKKHTIVRYLFRD